MHYKPRPRPRHCQQRCRFRTHILYVDAWQIPDAFSSPAYEAVTPFRTRHTRHDPDCMATCSTSWQIQAMIPMPDYTFLPDVCILAFLLL